ncbi:response regulator [Candidatus Poribacteria bacterium]
MERDTSQYTILLLDDDSDVITSLSSLLDLETDHKVLTFTSANEAAEAIETHEIDLAIVDYLMPGAMDGIDFLVALKNKQPYSIRMILTAYADKENAIKAINDVGLYKYLEKPWDNQQLLQIIQEGLEKRALLQQLKDQFGESILS